MPNAVQCDREGCDEVFERVPAIADGRNYCSKRCYGISRGGGSDGLYRDPDVLRELHHEKLLTISEMADLLSVSHGTISRYLKKNDIETIRAQKVRLRRKGATEDRLRELYLSKSLSPRVIGEKLNVSATTIRRQLDNFGIPSRSQSEAQLLETPAPLQDEQLLRELYVSQELTIPEIAERIDASSSSVGRWLRRHNIERRRPGVPEGEDNPFWKGGHSFNYGSGWWEARKKTRERDSHTCQRCGLSKSEHESTYNQQLNVHHIKRFRSFDDKDEANDLSNLITVCIPCHKHLEGNPELGRKFHPNNSHQFYLRL